MNGEVGILNVGAGDTKLSFDKSNPGERIRAARIVADMLKRGYALLVEVEPGKYQRARAFDEERCEYIIADFDPVEAAKADAAEETQRGEGGTTEAAGAVPEDQKVGDGTGPALRRKPGRPKKNVDAGTTRAIAVGKTAGG